jgi:hypothetical protein
MSCRAGMRAFNRVSDKLASIVQHFAEQWIINRAGVVVYVRCHNFGWSEVMGETLKVRRELLKNSARNGQH